MRRIRLDLETIVLTLIILVVGSIVVKSTQNALLKAKEKNTKDNIYTLEAVLKQQADAKIDLMEYLDICVKGEYCKVDKFFAENILLTTSKSPIPIIPGELKDSEGDYLKMKPTGENSYLIWGRSSKDDSLCWIASSNKKESNLESEIPSECP